MSHVEINSCIVLLIWDISLGLKEYFTFLCITRLDETNMMFLPKERNIFMCNVCWIYKKV